MMQAQSRDAQPNITLEPLHTFVSRDGKRYTMRDRRTNTIVTTQRHAQHYRFLNSAFTGVLEGRAGYADHYELEMVN